MTAAGPRTQDDPRPGRGGGARRRGLGPADAGGRPAAAGAERAQPHGDEGACRADHVDQLRRPLRRRPSPGRDAGPAPRRMHAHPPGPARGLRRRPRSPAGSRPGSVVPSGAPPPAASARSAASSENAHGQSASNREEENRHGRVRSSSNTGQIADIGSQTLNQRSQWDAIWESARARISATASEALDVATGGGLQERNDEYQPQVGALQPERAAAGPGREPDRIHRVGDQRPDGQHHPRRWGLRRRR